MKTLLLLLTSFILLNISAVFGADSVCSHFYNKLSELPYQQLTLRDDGFESLWDGNYQRGCEVFYESHVSLVSGSEVPPSLSYNVPWAVRNAMDPADIKADWVFMN